MRTTIPAFAVLILFGCSSAPAVKEQPPSTTPAITSLDDPAVVFDRSAVPVVDLTDSATNLPKLISKVDPTYPEAALSAQLKGTVVVKVLIAPSGQVCSTQILKTDAEIFNRPSLEAAMKWEFEPPVVDGKPAAVWVRVPFRYAVSAK